MNEYRTTAHGSKTGKLYTCVNAYPFPHLGQEGHMVRVVPTCIMDELLVLSRDALLPYCYDQGGASLLSCLGPGLSGAPEFLRGGVGRKREDAQPHHIIWSAVL